MPWLAAVVAFVWGGAGGSLYTLAMIDIGSREQGITLVNSTAVLVLSYTLGGTLAPALGGAMLDLITALNYSVAAAMSALILGIIALLQLAVVVILRRIGRGASLVEGLRK